MDDLRNRRRPVPDQPEADEDWADAAAYADDDRQSAAWRWAKIALLVGALLALVVGVVRTTSGEGSGGGFGPGSHMPPSGSGGEAFTPEQVAEFARCMRNEGMDVSDPQVGADGRIDMKPGAGVDVNGPAFQAALSVCRARFAPAVGQPAGGGHP